jgi:hypothetical protein
MICAGHVQVTVIRKEVFGCRLYWHDAGGDVLCVLYDDACSEGVLRCAMCVLYYNTHGTIYSTLDLLHITANRNTRIP